MMHVHRLLTLGLVGLVALVACSSSDSGSGATTVPGGPSGGRDGGPGGPGGDDDDDGGPTSGGGSGAPKLCAAVRGNGEYIVTHFASLSRIVEHYGVVEGIAGGSSGSITTFVYDSILSNAAITRCGGKACDAKTKAARVALALKSLQGYGETVAASKEALEIADLAGTVGRLKSEIDSRGILALLSSDTVKAASELKAVLSIPEVKTLANPEAFAMLEDVAHLSFNAKEVYTSITTLGAFSVDDNRLFFRPGALSWDGLSALFGRVADFYAGESGADTAGQAAWLDRCTAESVGKSWADIGPTPCGQDFGKLVTAYRDKVRAAGTASVRLQQTIGMTPGLHKLVSTSVLEGDAIAAWDEANTAYRAGTFPTGNVTFAPKFDDIKFGYWGASADYAKASGAKRFTDLKTSKMTSLGDKPWKEILTASPAEPGLSKFVKLPDGRMSAGGWSDLAPSLILKSMGCERVIYITREGDESGFATKIAKHLGMSEDAWKGLFDLGTSTSSFTQSLMNADGVWCTNWNSFTSLQQKELAADSWKAPLEAHAGFAGITTLITYPNLSPKLNKVGCTPGTPGTATYP